MLHYRQYSVLLIAGTLMLLLTACINKGNAPLAPVIEVRDNYYGKEISDPYRYMEDMDDTIFLGWMKEYAAYTRKQLEEIPGRESLRSQIEEFDKREADQVYLLKIAENGMYFYLKIKAEDELAKLYMRDGYKGKEKLLFDPKKWNAGAGENYVLNSIFPADNGSRVAVSLAKNGSEQSILIVIDVKTRVVLSGQVKEVAGSPIWVKDGKGFLYCRANSDDVHDPERLLDTKIWYHEVSTRQSRDILMFSSRAYPDVDMKSEEIPMILFDKDEEDYYLVLHTVDRYLRVFYSPSQTFNTKMRFQWKELIGIKDKVQNFYTIGDDLYLYTARNASGFEILKTSKRKPDHENASVFVPAPENGIITGFTYSKEAIYYKVRRNGVEEVLFRIPAGDSVAQEVPLPVKAGTLIVSTRGLKFKDVWVELYGWTLDGRRYRYLPKTGEFKQEPLSSEVEFPEFYDLEVKQCMVPSHDGTKVPLSIIYKKGTPLDGTAPAYMTGYGAYGSYNKPHFNPYRMIWTLKGGVVAVAHVRGGGELGEVWRLGGFKETKPNTWKDFIACAEYLIDNKYTSEENLAIHGRSAGGVLIGRAVTARPELFAAVISEVGVMNPLRVEQSPNGPVNVPEYGTVKDPVECKALIEMDGYTKIEDKVAYPATLVTGGFNDPRVIVWQPAKFAARLLAANNSRNPILFDVDYSSGHGLGDPKSKSIDDVVDVFSFALWQTGHPDFQK